MFVHMCVCVWGLFAELLSLFTNSMNLQFCFCVGMCALFKFVAKREGTGVGGVNTAGRGLVRHSWHGRESGKKSGTT